MKDINAMKNSSVEILSLSVRSSNYLKNLKINTIGELTGRKNLENPFVNICFSEHKAEKNIIVALSMLGLHLDMTDEDWEKWGLTEKKLPLPKDYYCSFFNHANFKSLQDIFIFVDDYLYLKGLVETDYTDITHHFNAEETTGYFCFSDINQAVSFYDENYKTMIHVIFLIEGDELKLSCSKKRLEEIYSKNDSKIKSLHVSLVPQKGNSKIRMIYQKI